MYDMLMSQIVNNDFYEFELLNNNYPIANCEHGELYFSKKRKEYAEVGYKGGMIVSFKVVEQDVWE